MQSVFSSSTSSPTSFPTFPKLTNYSCDSRTGKIALAAIASLVGFLFFPVGVAFCITGAVIIIAEIWTRTSSRIPSPIPKTQATKTQTPQKTPLKIKHAQFLSPVTPQQNKTTKIAASPMKEEMDRVARKIMSTAAPSDMSPIAVEIIDPQHPNDPPNTMVLRFTSEKAVREFMKVRANALSVLATIHCSNNEPKSLTLCLKDHVIEKGITVNQITSILQKIFGDDIRPITTPFKNRPTKLTTPAIVLSPIVTPNVQYHIKSIVCEPNLVTIEFQRKLERDAFYTKYHRSAPTFINFSKASTTKDACVRIAAIDKTTDEKTIMRWLEKEFGKNAIDNVHEKK